MDPRLAEVAPGDRRGIRRRAARGGGGERPDDAEGEWHRTQAIEANNSTWDLLGRDELSPEEADDLLGRAYTAMHHWRRAARRGPENAARAVVAGLPGPRRAGSGRCRPVPRRAVGGGRGSRSGWATSTWRTPTRRGLGRSPASADSRRPRPSWRPPGRCRSPTTRTARSSRATSPPAPGSASLADTARPRPITSDAKSRPEVAANFTRNRGIAEMRERPSSLRLDHERRSRAG